MQRSYDATEEIGRFSDDSAKRVPAARAWLLVAFALLAIALVALFPPVGT